jgi:hypothetical protein
MLNNADIYATTTSSLNIIFGMFYLEKVDKENEGKLFVIFVMLIFINVLFIIYWIFMMAPFVKSISLSFFKTLKKFANYETKNELVE